jgi:hypothetical protein
MPRKPTLVEVEHVSGPADEEAYINTLCLLIDFILEDRDATETSEKLASPRLT